MLATNVPVKVSVPFANSGTKNTIPVASQIGITPGAASFTDGFPPLTFTPKVSGGIPPFGADFNGILNAMSAAVRWACAGGSYSYDSAFSTAVTGYPSGAQIQRIDGTGFWLNLVDNNINNPETGGAGWVPTNNYGITPITGLTNANVTLTALQYARPVITLAGTLTGNVQIIFPTTLQEWLVVNNTTGAFTLTCIASGGTGGVVAQGGGQQTFWGDGTNLNPLSGNGSLPLAVGTATQPQHAMPLGQAVGRLLNVRTITSSGTYTPTTGTTRIRVTVIGGGGPGGTGGSTGASSVSPAGGGGGGGIAQSFLTTGFSGVSMTIGAAGNPSSSGYGTSGGTTSFGALLSATGGSSGALVSAATPPAMGFAGNGGGGASGNIFNSAGTAGATGFAISTAYAASGSGGGNAYAGGGIANAVTITGSVAGNGGNGFGAGGSGGISNISSALALGASGNPGGIIIEEFA